MGKVKQNKKKNRHKPTAMLSVQEAEDQREAGEGSSSLEEKTLPILEKLNCLEDRAHACAGLANLVLETDIVPSLMRHEIVRRVAPLILDEDEKIQEAATGVLRNLTLSGSPTICEEMLEQDIMTPVIFYIKKFSESIQDISKTCSKVVEKQCAVHEQVMHLLLNLSENASETVKKINDENIVLVLSTFLNVEVLDIKNVVLTAQCLCTITEDNPAAATLLANAKEALKILEKNLLCNEASEEIFLLKVHIAGVLFNIAQSLPSHVVFEMFQAIGNVFGKVLSFDINQCVQALQEKLKNNEEEEMMENGPSQNGEVHDGKDKVDVDEEIQKLRHLLEAQQITLEILTNMCCSGDNDDQEWDGVSSDEHSSEECDLNCSVDAEMEPDVDTSAISEEIMSSILSYELPKKVLEKCSFVKFTEGNEVLKGEELAGCFKIMETIQTRALVCLNNMLTTIDTDQLGGPEALTLLWNRIMEIAFQNNDSTSCFTRTDNEFIEAASSALRSALDKLADAKIQCVTTEQVVLLCHLSGVVTLEAARVNLMNVLGIIGKILMTSGSTDILELLQGIGTVLRDVVMGSGSLWVIAEALDAIFDVFADSSVADVAAGNIELLVHLEKVVPALKSRVKKERSTLGDRIPIINTARTNLVRFIKYKKQIS